MEFPYDSVSGLFSYCATVRYDMSDAELRALSFKLEPKEAPAGEAKPNS